MFTPNLSDLLCAYQPTRIPVNAALTLGGKATAAASGAAGSGSGVGVLGAGGDGPALSPTREFRHAARKRALEEGGARKCVVTELPGCATESGGPLHTASLPRLAPLLRESTRMVVFCVALSDYGRLLPACTETGTPSRNALLSALRDWEDLLATRAFRDEPPLMGAASGVPGEGGGGGGGVEAAAFLPQRRSATRITLLLTKIDLFETMLKRGIPMRYEGANDPVWEPPRFLDYRGGADYSAALAFIKGKFESIARKHDTRIEVAAVNMLEGRALGALLNCIVEGAFDALDELVQRQEMVGLEEIVEQAQLDTVKKVLTHNR